MQMTQDRWLSELHWRRESQQSRGERTQSALLDAAEELIVENGIEGASISDIAKRAKSSIGSVYHHFKDKKALLYAVFNRMTQAISDQNAQAADPELWKNASVIDLLDGYIAFRLEQSNAGGLSKRAMALVMADDPELKEHLAEIKREGNLSLKKLIMERSCEINHPDPDFAVGFVIDQISTMLYARSDPYQKRSALVESDDETFRSEVLRIACGVLGLPEHRSARKQNG